MKKTDKILGIWFFISASLFLSLNMALCYQWPFPPFNESCGITGTLGEYRQEPVVHFHKGVDIPRAKGKWVYAVESGVVTRINKDKYGNEIGVEIDDHFKYLHITPNVAEGQSITKGEMLDHDVIGTVLGEVQRVNHLHFEENYGDRNPLRTDGLSPFVDTAPPTINKIIFASNTAEDGSYTEITDKLTWKGQELIKLEGKDKVDIIVDCKDSMSVGSSTVAPYGITYNIIPKGVKGGGIIKSGGFAFDGIPTNPVPSLYALGSCTTKYFYIVTNNTGTNWDGWWDSTQVPDGDYQITVTVRDIRRDTSASSNYNKVTSTITVAVENKDPSFTNVVFSRDGDDCYFDDLNYWVPQGTSYLKILASEPLKEATMSLPNGIQYESTLEPVTTLKGTPCNNDYFHPFFTVPVDITNGAAQLVLTGKDRVGNSTSKNISFKIDTQRPNPPVINPIEGRLHDSFVGVGNVLTIEWPDAPSDPPKDGVASGMKEIKYFIDKEEPKTSDQLSTSISFPSPGEHALTAWAVDKAGNPSSVVQSTYIVDWTPPEISWSVYDSSCTKEGKVYFSLGSSITIRAIDPAIANGLSGSGVGKIEVNMDGKGWETYHGPFLVDIGEHEIKYKAVDNVGNESDIYSVSVVVVPPKIILPLSGQTVEGKPYFSYYAVGSGTDSQKFNKVTINAQGWETQPVTTTPWWRKKKAGDATSDPYPVYHLETIGWIKKDAQVLIEYNMVAEVEWQIACSGGIKFSNPVYYWAGPFDYGWMKADTVYKYGGGTSWGKWKIYLDVPDGTTFWLWADGATYCSWWNWYGTGKIRVKYQESSPASAALSYDVDGRAYGNTYGGTRLDYHGTTTLNFIRPGDGGNATGEIKDVTYTGSCEDNPNVNISVDGPTSFAGPQVSVAVTGCTDTGGSWTAKKFSDVDFLTTVDEIGNVNLILKYREQFPESEWPNLPPVDFDGERLSQWEVEGPYYPGTTQPNKEIEFTDTGDSSLQDNLLLLKNDDTFTVKAATAPIRNLFVEIRASAFVADLQSWEIQYSSDKVNWVTIASGKQPLITTYWNVSRLNGEYFLRLLVNEKEYDRISISIGKEIGPKGGTAKDFSEIVKINFPQNALSESCLITLAPCPRGEITIAEAIIPVSPIYEFLPHGLTFSTATITWKYTDVDGKVDGVDESLLWIYRYNPYEDKIEHLSDCEVDTVANIITGKITYFSYYFLAIRDVIPPKTTLTPSTALYFDGENYFAPIECGYSLSAVDNTGPAPSGVDYIMVKIDEEDWKIYTATITFSTEGEHTVKYNGVDKFGNWEEEKEFRVIVDATPPITSLTIGEPKYKEYVSAETPFSLTASDDGAGVKGTFYSINGATEIYTAPFTLVGADGSYTVGYWSVDNVENYETVKSTTVILDATPPVVEFVSPSPEAVGLGKIFNGPIPVIATVTDAHFDWYELSYAPGKDATDGFETIIKGTVPVMEGELTVWDVTELPSGYYTLKLFAQDWVKNTNEATAVIFVGEPEFISSYRYSFPVDGCDPDATVGAGIPLPFKPAYIALDEEGNSYVTEQALGRVIKFNSAGQMVDVFGGPCYKDILEKIEAFQTLIQTIIGDCGWLDEIVERIKEKLWVPEGIAVDKQGNIYVADRMGNRVVKFDPEGNLLLQIGGLKIEDLSSIVSILTGQNHSLFTFNWPVGIALDKDENIYVGDRFNNRVQKFDPQGNLVATIHTKIFDKDHLDWKLNWDWWYQKPFQNPGGIAVDNEGNIYVADQFHDRVLKFNQDGELLLEIGTDEDVSCSVTILTPWCEGEWSAGVTGGTGPGQFHNPDGIMVDEQEYIYVTDQGNNRIQKFDKYGNFVMQFGKGWEIDCGDPLLEEPPGGEFNHPGGIASDIVGNIQVVDRDYYRVQVFGLPEEVAPPEEEEPGLAVSLDFTSTPSVSVAGVLSSTFTITRYDANGVPTTRGETVIRLTSDAPDLSQAFQYAGVTTSTVTISKGESSVSFYYYSEKAGDWTITASAEDITSVATCRIKVIAGMVAHFVGKEVPNLLSQGEVSSILVEACDAFGNRVKDYRGKIKFLCDDLKALLPEEYTFTSSDAGVHAFTNAVIFNTPGERKIEIIDEINNLKETLADITVTDPVPPNVVAEFQATPIEGRRIRLDWAVSTSSDVACYNIYFDSGAGIINYATPIASLKHPTSYWISEPLPGGVTYKFGIRTEDITKNEEKNTRVIASATVPKDSYEPVVRAMIKVPQTGKKISGSRITVIAEITKGAISEVRGVRFQYRKEGTENWKSIPALGSVHPNPDLSWPYFIHWDISDSNTYPDGNYELRAVAYGEGYAWDKEPPGIMITIDRVEPDVTEKEIGNSFIKTEKIDNGRENVIKIGEDAINNLTEVSIPQGALGTETAKLSITLNPANVPAAQKALVPIGECRKIELDNGQKKFLNGKMITIVIPYQDKDNDGKVDGTEILENALAMCFYDEDKARWQEISGIVVDEDKNTCIAQVNHLSLFALFGPAPEEETLTHFCVYPNPSRGSDGDVIFGGLNGHTKIWVYNIAGELVKIIEHDPSSEDARWDKRNENGQPVASGIYIYVIKGSPTLKKGKLAIIK